MKPRSPIQSQQYVVNQINKHFRDFYIHTYAYNRIWHPYTRIRLVGCDLHYLFLYSVNYIKFTYNTYLPNNSLIRSDSYIL